MSEAKKIVPVTDEWIHITNIEGDLLEIVPTKDLKKRFKNTKVMYSGDGILWLFD